MIAPDQSRFWHSALKSGLISQDALRVCGDAIPPEKRTPDAIDRRLARKAVENGFLTVWQAQQILSGRFTGFVVDKYVLLDRIGQGGMGRVFLARDTRLQRKVAIKLLSPERMRNERAVARFEREARVGAQLQHVNLVRIYDVGEASGILYLVMEFIDGKNVGQMVVEGGRLAPSLAARIVRDIALGLDHARVKGLIHRDVHPWNILLTHDGQAKLTDLGLAIEKDEDRDVPVTRDGATVGNFDFISPEQARDSHAADTRSDIYSLGCSFYHMLTGRLPFPEPSLPGKLLAHQSQEPEPLETFAPDLPPGLGAIVRKMTRKNPADRYATPAEIARDLEPFVDERAPAPATGPSPRTAAAGGVETRRVPPSSGGGSGASTAAWSGGPGPGPSVEVSNSGPNNGPASGGVPLAARSTTSAGAVAVIPAEDGPALDLGIRLGPDASLSATTSNALAFEINFNVDTSAEDAEVPAVAKAVPSPDLERTRFRRKLFIILGLAFLAVWIVPLCVIFWGGPRADRTIAQSQAIRQAEEKAATRPTQRPSLTRAQVASGIAVWYPSDGSFVAEANLQEALGRAGRGEGRVVLVGSEPIVVDQPVYSTGNRVIVEAAEGDRPVLTVKLAPGVPWFSTRVPGSVTFRGLTIEAGVAAEGRSGSPPVLLEVAGTLALEQCRLRYQGAAETPEATAVALVQTARVNVVGCRFEGWSKALDLEVGSDFQATIKDTSFADGWALSLRRASRGASGSVRFELCTISGTGVLTLTASPDPQPLRVTFLRNTVETQALVKWSGGLSDLPKALAWTDQGNRYALRGADWVVADDGKGALTPLADGPRDEASWRKLVVRP